MKSILKIMFAAIAAYVFLSCDNVANPETDEKTEGASLSIKGYAQKGQLIKGSSITAYAMNEKLQPTGQSYPSVISDDMGSFMISAQMDAPYMELRAEGYYFVENIGETSVAPIYLNALVSSSQEKVNVNLLTTITCGRIKKLIADGKDFSQAKEQAEQEALTAFAISGNDIDLGFEEMNISKDGEANAVLLAASS